MATSAKPKDDERPPEQIWVEMSPTLYRAILQMAEAQGSPLSADELRKVLERHLSDNIAHALSEVTGVAVPFPQGVDIELQIASSEAEFDDDDDAVRASIKQGLRDVLAGNVLTEEEFWKAVADDE